MYNVFPMLSIIESKYMYYELINWCKGSKKKDIRASYIS